MQTVAAPAPSITPLPAEAGRPAVADHRSSLADVRAVPVALCAVCLGLAVNVNFGQYHPLALLWVSVALVGTVLCVANPGSTVLRALGSRMRVILGIACAVQFALLLVGSPGATGALAAHGPFTEFRAGMLCAGVVCAAGLWLMPRWYLSSLLALLAVFVALGTWVLHASPGPGVDVVLFQREAAEAVLRGDNPYAITFADPYRDSSRFYGPGVSANGRLQFGYPYPPLSLLLVLPAHLLGDFRYGHLAAMAGAGALVALARPGRVAFAAAALMLFTPRGFFVLEAGWTEPLAVLGLAAVVFVACRARRSLPVALGCLLALKQYLVFALLVSPLLQVRLRGLRLKALVVASLVTLPWALWDASAFVRSAVLLQFRQPFRDDALSYLVPLGRLLGVHPPAWIAFVAAGAAALLAGRRCPRTPAGFALGLGLVLLAFFAFNKQAFCNYYHLVIACLCCAAGAAQPPRQIDAPERPE